MNVEEIIALEWAELDRRQDEVWSFVRSLGLKELGLLGRKIYDMQHSPAESDSDHVLSAIQGMVIEVGHEKVDGMIRNLSVPDDGLYFDENGSEFSRFHLWDLIEFLKGKYRGKNKAPEELKLRVLIALTSLMKLHCSVDDEE